MSADVSLSMLWETGDPGTALTARFGFADTGDAVSWLTDRLGDAWGLSVDRCDRLVLSATNLLAWVTAGGQRVIAKCSGDQTRSARLDEIDAVTSWLSAEGIPVAAPIAAQDGRLRVERRGVSLGLQPVMDGDLLDVGDSEQVGTAGRMLATLHEVLAAYPRPFDGGPTRQGQQLVHNDFRSANILSDGARISAILDFEEVTYRSRVADLAKVAVLLGTRYRDWRPTDPATRDAFIASYCGVVPLTGAQRDELARGVRAVLNYFGWT